LSNYVSEFFRRREELRAEYNIREEKYEVEVRPAYRSIC